MPSEHHADVCPDLASLAGELWELLEREADEPVHVTRPPNHQYVGTAIRQGPVGRRVLVVMLAVETDFRAGAACQPVGGAEGSRRPTLWFLSPSSYLLEDLSHPFDEALHVSAFINCERVNGRTEWLVEKVADK